MVEKLEFLIRRAALNTNLPRRAVFKELLRSQTYVLTVGGSADAEESVYRAKAHSTFPVWADNDPDFGGVWVPVFPARDRVKEFVSKRGLKAPLGKEFLWMGHMPGQVFGLMRGVRRFAGVRLYADADTSMTLTWTEVRELSQGRVNDMGIRRYEMPLDRIVIPAGTRLAFGRLAPWPGESSPSLLLMPTAGRFSPEDTRRLVRLPMMGRDMWVPCRHFLQILRRLQGADENIGVFLEKLFASFLAFEMYGEAEALCEWLAHLGHEAYAWVGLSAVYGRCDRFEECQQLCRRGTAKYPHERAFRINGIRALTALGREDEAAQVAAQAVREFPDDPALAELFRVSAASAESAHRTHQ